VGLVLVVVDPMLALALLAVMVRAIPVLAAVVATSRELTQLLLENLLMAAAVVVVLLEQRLLAAQLFMAAAVVVGVTVPQHQLVAHQPTAALVALVLPLPLLLELLPLAAAAAGLPLALALAAKFVSGSFAKGLTNVSIRS
jgi:hypothetical protein